MGTFKIQAQGRLVLTQILDGAATIGGKRLLAWNARSPRLNSGYGGAKANVIHADHRFEIRHRDSQIVSEFKLKLRRTEDLLNKLGFSLRELFPED